VTSKIGETGSFFSIRAGTLAKIGDLVCDDARDVACTKSDQALTETAHRERCFGIGSLVSRRAEVLRRSKTRENEHFPLRHSQKQLLGTTFASTKTTRPRDRKKSPISWRVVMLVLSRKQGEQVVLGNGITVTLVEVAGNRARLGIEAPDSVPILRGELPSWQGAQPGNKEPFEPAFVCEW
jgi:carbon storage regulator